MSYFVAIVGRPNVGKSTLFNRLIGERRAIVDDRPGVTRDRCYAQVQLSGRAVTLVDTGGFDLDEKEGLLAQVRAQTLLAVQEADLTILMTDGREGLTPTDRELVRLLRRSARPFLLVVNKIDGPEKEDLLTDFHELGVEPVLPVSAAHGYGLRTCQEHVIELLPDRPEAAVPSGQVRVAVIGRPNVGKSSLVNRLCGQERVLVSPTPGTTRDPVDLTIEHRGRSYLFVDTAGIRKKGRIADRVEKYAIMRALHSLDRCDLALLIIDAIEGVTDQDAHVAGYALERGRGLILLFNKWDTVKDKQEAKTKIERDLDLKLRFLSYAPWLTISALTGLGLRRVYPLIDELFRQLDSRATTSRVNQVLAKAIQDHTPPYVGRGRLKFYYGTQTGTKPPTFVLFANRPDKVHFSYHRYLSNCFREAFGLTKVPVEVLIRPRNKGDH